MSSITRSRPAVKPTRRTVRPARPFAEGIFTRRMPYTAADLAWAAQVLNENATDFDVIEPDYDALAAEAEARLDMGLCL